MLYPTTHHHIILTLDVEETTLLSAWRTTQSQALLWGPWRSKPERTPLVDLHRGEDIVRLTLTCKILPVTSEVSQRAKSRGGTKNCRRSGPSKPASSAGKRSCQPGQGTGKAKPAPTQAKEQPVESLQHSRRSLQLPSRHQPQLRLQLQWSLQHRSRLQRKSRPQHQQRLQHQKRHLRHQLHHRRQLQEMQRWFHLYNHQCQHPPVKSNWRTMKACQKATTSPPSNLQRSPYPGTGWKGLDRHHQTKGKPLSSYEEEAR